MVAVPALGQDRGLWDGLGVRRCKVRAQVAGPAGNADYSTANGISQARRRSEEDDDEERL